jgi:flagellar protein FliL
MATQAIEQVSDADAAEAAPAAAPGKRNLIILAVAGLVAGTAAGLFGVGPILAKKRASSPASEVASEAKNESAVNHSIENIVLNPAGTNGQRFLMVTAAFQLKDASIDPIMKEHEPEIRDHMLALLSKKTVEELTDPAKRDPIKQEVLAVVAPMFPKGALLKVLFTQFVVQ